MAGLAFILRRDGGPVSGAEMDRMLRAMAPCGPDGADARLLGDRALGHRHFWTTPEEVGERQPLADAAGRIHLAFDGRLDNREELLRLLAAAGEAPAPRAPGRAASDAEIVLAAYRRWGEACLELFLGPFALVVLDLDRRRLLLGRDALGDRRLVYRIGTEAVLVASSEAALLAVPSISAALDSETVARFFALLPPAPGRTFFADLRELPPAHGLRLDLEGREEPRLWRHWRPGGGPEVRYRRESEYAEHFREALAEAVRCRMRTTGAASAVLMSGGLDSTSVAALAARELGPDGGPLHTLSWVFDELPEADEREFMEPVVARLGARATWIRCDDAWPLRDAERWPTSLDAPYSPIYRRPRERAYHAAAAAGSRVLLTGECGDHLYFGAAHWLRDLVAEGRVLAAAGGLARELALGRRRDLPRVGLRDTAGRLAGWRPRPQPPPTWLTPFAVEQLGDAGSGFAARHPVARPEQAARLFDPRLGAANSLEAAFAGAAGLEVRRPYRDRRLIELALALPAHQLYRPGWIKWVGRQAMRGLLPDPVRLRRRRSSLYPLFRRGLVERESDAVQGLLEAPGATWSRYVRRDWLDAFLPDRILAGVDGPAALATWQCLGFELWRRKLGVSSASVPALIRLVS